MRLIDADELMEHAWRDKLDSRELIAKMIENAPTVAADVAPVVHGKWKDAMQSCHDSPHVKCSVCGEYYWRYFNKFNFCPHCGAKMEG